jgi:hypothetical protein
VKRTLACQGSGKAEVWTTCSRWLRTAVVSRETQCGYEAVEDPRCPGRIRASFWTACLFANLDKLPFGTRRGQAAEGQRGSKAQSCTERGSKADNCGYGALRIVY